MDILYSDNKYIEILYTKTQEIRNFLSIEVPKQTIMVLFGTNAQCIIMLYTSKIMYLLLMRCLCTLYM